MFVLLWSLSAITGCKNQTSSPAELLIGEWIRDDHSEDFHFKFIFDENQSGQKITFVRDADRNAISSLQTFTWDAGDDELQFDYDGKKESTGFSITDDGKLYLKELSKLPFSKQTASQGGEKR